MDAYLPDGTSDTGVLGIINQAASRYGIPAWIPKDIAMRESSLNPNTIGDYSTSFGLFQLHRGNGLGGNLPISDLLDPATNTDIAVKNMTGVYRTGVAQGLTGVDLLDYVANTGGWPGQLGVAWTNQNRPDYNKRLNEIYNNGGQATYGPYASMDSVGGNLDSSGHYVGVASNSGAANIFRAINQKESITSYKDWKAKASVLSTPFSYMAEQGASLTVRTLITLLGIAIILIAIVAMVRPAAAAVASVEAGAIPGKAAGDGF